MYPWIGKKFGMFVQEILRYITNDMNPFFTRGIRISNSYDTWECATNMTIAGEFSPISFKLYLRYIKELQSFLGKYVNTILKKIFF